MVLDSNTVINLGATKQYIAHYLCAKVIASEISVCSRETKTNIVNKGNDKIHVHVTRSSN